APLKRLRTTQNSSSASGFPRASARGPIEALTLAARRASPSTFPRASARGPIEAADPDVSRFVRDVKGQLVAIEVQVRAILPRHPFLGQLRVPFLSPSLVLAQQFDFFPQRADFRNTVQTQQLAPLAGRLITQ